MNLNELNSVLAAHFNKDRHILAAYLFGSFANGKATKNSDIDIALLLSATVKRADYEDIAVRHTCNLIKLLKLDKIDILIMNSAGPLVRQQVYNKGKMIFCRNTKLAIRFKDLHIAEYLDFLPFRQMNEKRVLQRIANGGKHG